MPDSLHQDAQHERRARRQEQNDAVQSHLDEIESLRRDIARLKLEHHEPLKERLLPRLKPYMQSIERDEYLPGLELTQVDWFEHYVGHYALSGMNMLSAFGKTPDAIIDNLKITHRKMGQHLDEFDTLREAIKAIPDERASADKVSAIEAINAFEAEFRSVLAKSQELVAASPTNTRKKG